MKFEIRYPTGVQHEVELQGSIATLGRDPSSDLVLNDPKCSRRHAVIEAGPQGLVIRDSGSANGIYVNGRKVERSPLKAGDELRLGDVIVKVLPEEAAGTVVMGPEDLHDLGPLPSSPPPPGPPQRLPPTEPEVPLAQDVRPTATVPPIAPPRRPPAPPPPPRPAAPARPVVAAPGAPRPMVGPRVAADALPRPVTVTVLAVLWLLGVVLYGAAAIVSFLWRSRFPEAATSLLVGGIVWVLLALVSGAIGVGLLTRGGWARIFQIIFSALGLLTCVFTIPSGVILAYMLRPDVKLRFSRRRDLSSEEVDLVGRSGSGVGFTVAVLGTLFLSFGLLGGLGLFFGGAAANLGEARQRALEAAAIGRVRVVISAQAAFESVCGSGYADLEGLTNPASVVPDYLAGGPAFLMPESATPEAYGYRFDLKVRDSLPPTEGCTRRFGRYEYSASPLSGRGRHFLGSPEGIIYVAQGRPATTNDPPLE